jgi:hypothetical protein
MNTRGLLKVWQEIHGPLTRGHREEFLARVEVVEIVKYPSRPIYNYLPDHPKLLDLLERLRANAAIEGKKPQPQASGEQPVRYRPSKTPNNPSPKKTEPKGDRPNREEMKRLWGIAQSNKWWS